MNDRIRLAGNVCFWIAIVTELIVVIIDKSAYINPYEGMIFRLTFLLFCLKVISTKYSRREWICIIAVGLIVSISYFVNTRDEAVRAAVFVIACKDIDLKKILKVVLAITLIGTLILCRNGNLWKSYSDCQFWKRTVSGRGRNEILFWDGASECVSVHAVYDEYGSAVFMGRQDEMVSFCGGYRCQLYYVRLY